MLGINTSHPIDGAIIEFAADKKMKIIGAENFSQKIGKGISGIIDSKKYSLGNKKMSDELGVVFSKDVNENIAGLEAKGKTALILLEEDIIGIIGVSDTVKNSATDSVNLLKNIGIEVWMITGDNERAAKAVADSVGIKNVMASVLPQNKSEKIQELQRQGKKVAMVGDGINDAPALAQSDIGIAIGTGTDVAIESAGITLSSGNPIGIYKSIILARKTLLNIK